MSLDSMIEKTILKESELFKNTNEKILNELLNISVPITLAKDQILFQANEISNDIYILVKGRLAAYTESGHLSGVIRPGELVGEIGVFARDKQVLTVKTLKNSKLLKFNSAQFLELCDKNNQLLKEVNLLLIKKLRSTLQSFENKPSRTRTSCLIASSINTNYESFFKALEICLRGTQAILVTQHKYEQLAPQKNISEWFDQLEAEYKHVIYVVNQNDQKWREACMDNSEKLYLLVDADGQQSFNQSVVKTLNAESHELLEKNMILIRSSRHTKIRATSRWLDIIKSDNHFHVALDDTKSLMRLLRFILDCPVSVTMSAGSFKGWTTLGMFKAFYEQGIPIDYIGGVSIGAILGAQYIMSENYDELYEKFNRFYTAIEKPFKLRRYTIPVTSFLSWATGTKIIKEIFGFQTIEDLPVNFFCVSFNLSKSLLHVFRTGQLWLALRASSSIPVLVPPVEINGDLHIDGAITNYFPIDITHELLRSSGIYIGADLSNVEYITEKYSFPPVLTPLNLIMHKLRIKKYALPSLNTILIESLFAGSYYARVHNLPKADVLIRPELTAYKEWNLTRENIKKMVEIGYNEALTALEKNAVLFDKLLF